MTEKLQSEQSLDSSLDEALEVTFPASDQIVVHLPDPTPRNDIKVREPDG